MIAPNLLQDVADYRGVLQRWFALLAVGGVLIVTVPHSFLFERQDSAPSLRRPGQRRLYSPRALIEEIEEALVPNSYRVRWLGDLDRGYDYASTDIVRGQAEVGLAIERIAPPAWGISAHREGVPAPVDLFEPDRDRVERAVLAPSTRILAVKLDHLGDFVMGIGALERLRSAFPTAEITLVVGSWNEGLAREIGIADQVLVFDAFPRNASEEVPDIAGRTALFDMLVTGEYDLAIDLRTELDSRHLLRNVRASVKAGIGLQAHYPYLDIALPVNPHIGGADVAWSERFDPDRFHSQGLGVSTPFSITFPGGAASIPESPILFGPYRALPVGEFVFEPYLEIGADHRGLLGCDVALNTQRIAYAVGDETRALQLAFSNKQEGALFEFRLFAVEGEPTPDFRFYGGRLSKRGTSSALHQSEYLILLVELIALRVTQTGLLRGGCP